MAAFAARGVLRARLRALLPEPGSETTGSGGSLPFERELLRTVFIKVMRNTRTYQKRSDAGVVRDSSFTQKCGDGVAAL
jgi:hypothetical protein